MKRYKHTKDETIIVTQNANGDYIFDHNLKVGLQPKLVEDCQDWILIKDYTILTRNSLYIPNNKGIHSPNSRCSENSSNTCIIWSVRRESDQLVFTVGDDYPLILSNITKIKRFDLIDDNIYIATESGDIFNLPSWKKHKEKLFTTIDGVDIYRGYNYWTVSDDFNVYYSSNACNNESSKAGWKRAFSTEQSAYDYVKLNKPIFSAQDFLDHPYLTVASVKRGSFRLLDRYLNLEKLIDSKLKL